MIFTDRIVTVRKGESKINESIIIYRGDYELEVRFTIMNSKFKFMSGTNLIESEKATYGQLAILTPYGGNIFSEVAKCNDGTVTFVLTTAMLDQIEEVGLYSFQIRLFDYNKESRVSIPPVEFGIEVREPITSEDHDNSVNNAIVGYSIAKIADALNETVPDTFDADGQYNKTDWETGDRITEGKLNKIEVAIDTINQNEINDKNTLNKQMTSNFNVLQSQIDNLVIESGNTDAEVEQARGEYDLLNQRLNAMDSQLEHIENDTSRIINIDNFNDIQEAIDYAKEYKKKITGDKIILDRNVSFRGVELDVNILDIKGYTVELGGYYTPDITGQACTNPPQNINKILKTTLTGTEQVFIRGSVGQKIRIGQYYGNVNLRMNETDRYNAYSTFEFGYVTGVVIGNDEDVPTDTTKVLWCNENVFYINRCNRFIMDGTFPHDLNRIYGGCFEGSAMIEIRTGKCNTFYDMRFEGSESVTIKFSKGTVGNRIYRNDDYFINVEDQGRNNGIITQQYRDVVLLSNQSITTTSFNENYLGMFSNLIKTEDGLGIKPTSDTLVTLYESEFIDHPSAVMFIAKCNRKVGNGIAVKYSVYDENYNKLDGLDNLRSTFYCNSNAYNSIMVNKDEGSYVLPGAQASNRTDCTDGVYYNDNVNLIPSAHFTKNENAHLIKYVKFFIISSSYFNPGSEYYDITASVYRMNGSLYTKYFY